ncbi:unnamed protein product (macronuclear) [Paramecium tetraurelia]|uniref:RING-type E3 ubiquitin transferase n=1 Tax=Paramecium tetraurelia TaxID=5888 RepID=A0DLL3_PARTE|nr:uncharacterized protein GSPATT00018248001 [Paramecium tetraurelia]CAK83930.1 unnamed protein product [Paramecium tetraurelia]|eukprot:XP_001451327.1 hypothetical protein (macronuclear) [Paramecium tetraurelia strain d4-2]
MGQAQPAQMNSQQEEQSNAKLTQYPAQKNEKNVESQELNSNQPNQYQFTQNLNSHQNDKADLQNIDEEIQSAQDIENIWLTRTFGIFTNTQQIYGKEVDFIPKNQILTVDFLIEQVYYQFLTSSQFTEQEKLDFLIKSLSSLSNSQVTNEIVNLAEGKIKKERYFDLLNHIQGQLLTCTLYPDAFEWQNIDEDPNVFEDAKNFRANIIFNEIFCSNNFGISQNTLINLLDYLETQASEDDSFKFLELMLKRELKLYTRLAFDDIRLQQHSLALLHILAQYKKLMEKLLSNSWAYCNFDLINTGINFQQRSLVGILLSLSSFPTDGHLWKSHFSDDRKQMMEQMSSLRTRMFTIIDDLCMLFEKILNSNEILRYKFFEFLSNIIKLNLNLEKQLNIQLQKLSSSPGLVNHLFYILTYLFNKFADSQTTINLFIKKIDLNLLSYCKKHPLFQPLYQNVDLLASELTPFVEPKEFKTIIDPMTALYLLTQRLSHIVATCLQQFYISTIMREMKDLPQEAFQTQVFDILLKRKISFDLQILHPKGIKYITQFLSFANQLALSLIDTDLKPIYPYGLLSATFLIDTQTFVSIYAYNDEIINYVIELQKCCEFAAISMNKKLLPNPHLRIRSINIFQIIDETKGSFLQKYTRQNWRQSQELNILFDSKFLRTCLVDGLIQSFIDTEKVAEGNQYFQKLNIRVKICLIIRYLLQVHKSLYQESLFHGFKNDQEQQLHFSNYFLNDFIYVIEECLLSLKNIKKLQVEQQSFFQNHQLHKLQKELTIKSQFFYEYLRSLEVITSIQPEIFLIDEIREKLAIHLNYILEQINGKSSEDIAQNIDVQNFDKMFVVEILINVYTNLRKNQQFILEVVKDERSFSVELFKKTQNETKQYINYEKYSLQFEEFINQVEELSQKQKVLFQNQEDIPEEFLDPLCFSFMNDPVKLPHSNVIVDRLTIKKHLLNNSIDPFDRSPLTLDMVIEQKELKQKIDEYIAKNLEKLINKQTLNQEQK